MPEFTSKPLEVVVTVDEKHLSRLSAIASQLESAGLMNAQIMAGIGVITGQATKDSMSDLKGIEGILTVDQSGQVQIAPPDSSIQ